jgi:hypothetical protein
MSAGEVIMRVIVQALTYRAIRAAPWWLTAGVLLVLLLASAK